MKIASLIISMVALAFSIVAFMIGRRLETAKFDIERDLSFEGRLADWPQAFKLHGVDIDTAKSEGLTPEQIAYMILSINALAAYCAAIGKDLYNQIMTSDYRQRMFAQPLTRRAWRYARLCIPKDTGKHIDRYLMEKHGEEYGVNP